MLRFVIDPALRRPARREGPCATAWNWKTCRCNGAAIREWLIDFRDRGYIALYRFDEQTAVILAVRYQQEMGYR